MSLDGLRFARAGLLIGWILISTLVVAGFAAFSADDEPVDPATLSTLDVEVGRTAGAVAALAFAGTADTLAPTDTGPGEPIDPKAPTMAIQRATTETTSDKRGGVYVRSGYLTETAMRELVAAHFQPGDVNRAIRVAWCLSSFNPAAMNPATGASGLFQHLPDTWAGHAEAAGRPGGSIFDPETNVAVAAWMLYDLPGGWSHWDCGP